MPKKKHKISAFRCEFKALKAALMAWPAGTILVVTNASGPRVYRRVDRPHTLVEDLPESEEAVIWLGEFQVPIVDASYKDPLFTLQWVDFPPGMDAYFKLRFG